MRIRLARGDGAAGKKQCYSKEKKYDYSHKNDSIEVQVQKTLTTNPFHRYKMTTNPLVLIIFKNTQSYDCLIPWLASLIYIYRGVDLFNYYNLQSYFN
jgi:hypothetical protein